jgi:holo-[acyl-carrier protein] synthase
MAVRVGIDLVAVKAVRDAVSEHGDRYLNRIYTEAEIQECLTPQGLISERLAARFAAKEATLKVLRPSGDAVPWRNMQVIRHPSGWVELELSGHAATLAADQGLGDFALSMSHEADYATAVVVASQT